MVAAPFPRHTAPPLGAPAVDKPRLSRPQPAQDEAARLAAALFDRVLCGTPRRAALMTLDPANKYRDVKGHQFTAADALDHLRKGRTWATTLQNADGLTRTALRDYDAATEAEIWAALEAARAGGILGAAAFLMPGADDQHYGGHVTWHYAAPVPAVDAAAHMAAVLPQGAGEIFPSNQCARFPFGYHRIKGTRGELLMLGPDGERQRWRLDSGGELVAGLRAYLAAGRNAAPPEAPPAVRERLAGGIFGASYDPAHWEGLSDALGGRYMAAARFTGPHGYFNNPNRPQLGTLLRGGRVTTMRRDGTPDDSDSAQVAVLINNLITAAHKHPTGALIPGHGAPPEAEIRAIALWFKDRLRPGTSDEHYRAQVDYEIARYRPAGYAPAATRYLPAAGLALPEGPRVEARHRGRPAGQRAAQAAQLLDLLAARVGQDVKLAELGRLLDNPVSGRMVAAYLADLGDAVTLRRAGHGLRVEAVARSEINCPPPSAEQPAEAATPIGNREAAEAATERAPTLQTDDAGAHMEVHTAPPGPASCPAPAAPGAAGDDAAPLDAEQLAELVARLEDAAALIRGERVERLHRATGEIVTHQRKATRKALAAALAELPPAHFAAAYAAWKATPWWVKEQRRLRSVELPEELYREQDGHRAALRRAGSDAPPPWAELPPERRAALVQRARSSSMRGAALVARARSEAPPAALSDAAAELLAQVQHRRAVEAHARAVRDVPRRTVLRDLVARELRRRQLPAERPGRAPIGRRAKPPTDAQVARAQAARQAELWAELDRIRARGRPAPAAAQETPPGGCSPQAPPPDPAPVEAPPVPSAEPGPGVAAVAGNDQGFAQVESPAAAPGRGGAGDALQNRQIDGFAPSAIRTAEGAPVPLPPVERADLAMIARLRARLEAGKVAACAD